jgi:hypothetical protein
VLGKGKKKQFGAKGLKEVSLPFETQKKRIFAKKRSDPLLMPKYTHQTQNGPWDRKIWMEIDRKNFIKN